MALPGLMRPIERPDLQSFTKSMLERYPFPGTLRAVVFVAEGGHPSQEVFVVFFFFGLLCLFFVAGGHRENDPQTYR